MALSKMLMRRIILASVDQLLYSILNFVPEEQLVFCGYAQLSPVAGIETLHRQTVQQKFDNLKDFFDDPLKDELFDCTMPSTIIALSTLMRMDMAFLCGVSVIGSTGAIAAFSSTILITFNCSSRVVK
uniref:Uncharacterized protein n=1 Tax=Glossina pallidipes TaxID=7398 RepID=A0A1B0A922_GLOPL